MVARCLQLFTTIFTFSVAMDKLKLPAKYLYKEEESKFEDICSFRIKDVFTEEDVNVSFYAFLRCHCVHNMKYIEDYLLNFVT